MLFSSIPFLYYFLPIVFLLYFAIPQQFKNLWLFISSLVFYAWGEPRFVIIMLISITVGYLSGILLEKHKSKLLLCFSVFVPLAFLLYFKYADFFITNFSLATGISIPLLRVSLPIGISFYTFQIISYQVDVYRGRAAQKNPINLGTFIALFPQLIAGPIVRYVDIEKELVGRKHSISLTSSGMARFCIGLFKKIVIANTLGTLVSKLGSISQPSVLFYWLIALAVSLQIYFDFSGYSDMAIGLGRVFGFKFLENFNYPFISRSVTEFWRRWHMSLGTWFRDYVYIPMGGNRVKPLRHIFNILIVWMLTGFWHGADWNFIIWGLFFAVLLIIEKFFIGGFLKKYCVVSHIYVILVTLVSFTIFNSVGLDALTLAFKSMFGFANLPIISFETLYYLKNYAIIIIISVIGSTPLLKTVFKSFPDRLQNVLLVVFIPVSIIICTAFLADGSFNPFLYFRF